MLNMAKRLQQVCTADVFTHKRIYITSGVRHGFTPVHSVLGAGTHRLSPAMIELARHCCLVTTSWPEREKTDIEGHSFH